MIKVGFITAPLTNANAVRGVGFYTRRLLPELKKQAKDFGLEILEINSLDQLEQLGQLEIVHYPYFDLFRHTLPIYKQIKTIVTVHDVIPLEFPDHYPPGLQGWFNLQLQKIALSRVEGVITDSHASVKSIHKYLGVPHAKLKLVYLAADQIFKKVANPKNKFNLPKKFVLYVGDVNYNKNIPNLVTACKLANFPLVIVGKQAAQLENLDLAHPELCHLQNLNLDSVLRLGFVSDDDLVNIYNLATVYCQPSFSEGSGLPVLEALACGTPVACSNTSSLPEIAGDNAAYFDPHDVKSMSQAIIKAINHQPSTKNLSQFSWQETAKQTLMVYQEIL